METTGICKICNSEITRKGRNRHFVSCLKKNNKIGNNKYFLLSIEGKYDSDYWMNIIVKKNWKLEVLDSFLRDIWLECCGHLSEFDIKGTVYSVSPNEEFDDNSMNYKIGDVLGVKDKFLHTYDYGSSTELILKVLSEFSIEKNIKRPEILARNQMPEIKCNKCDNLATNVCCDCIYEGSGWLCDKCSTKHECGEDMLLPVVNSPRVGVCGYCG